ncbi:uncharacterized protein BJ171DRAFT_197201 [Polychytrium aggregatum]|uniref:uncharacterized protein n=1 Tax=Polychytrium aggregatum TaxID=110093 RepID=UPI0022FE1405|nr:uncharacterized protein BJ171DRAFT_197201 [Polychytrium aggregatum]KAI9201891.1 hypothetical protein BJ171DRAFT_197201 [Polychytrium aggregatum]
MISCIALLLPTLLSVYGSLPPYHSPINHDLASLSLSFVQNEKLYSTLWPTISPCLNTPILLVTMAIGPALDTSVPPTSPIHSRMPPVPRSSCSTVCNM